MALTNKLSAIGDAIRDKTGTADLLKLDDMPNAIASITSGAEPKLKRVTINATTSYQTVKPDGDYDGFSRIEVNPVTSSIDENIKSTNIREGVSILGVVGTVEEGISPTGTVEITNNGTYDIAQYETATVQVPSGGKCAPRTISFYSFSGADEQFQKSVSALDSSKLISLSGVFSSMTGTGWTLDISHFNVQSASSINGMCKNSAGLKKVNMAFSNFGKISDIKEAFYGCSKLEEVIMPTTPTQMSVKDVSNLFYGCKALKSIDLSAFILPNLTNTKNMFYNCTSLNFIDIRNMDFTNVTSKTAMFSDVPKPCTIIVKDDVQKQWLTDNYSSYADCYKTVAEYQAEGGV